MIGRAIRTLVAGALVALCAPADAQPSPSRPLPPGFEAKPLAIPDPVMIDQSARRVRFNTDVIAGHTVAVAFMFTGCSTTCPMTAQMLREVQDLLPDQIGRSMRLVVVSVDPLGDTPQRIGAYMRKLGAGPGFMFLTGSREGSDAIQQAFAGRAGRGAAHTTSIFVIGGKSRAWTRVSAVGTAPAVLAQRLQQAAAIGLSRQEAAARFFTNLPMQDQNGRDVRFYRDLVQNRVTVMNTLFTRCGDSCPILTQKLRKVRSMLADQRVKFVSISSDPTFDSPVRLRAFAASQSLPEDWSLIGGKRENVDWVLYKLGLSGTGPSDHSTELLVFNDRAMLMKRIAPTASPTQIVGAIRDSLSAPDMP